MSGRAPWPPCAGVRHSPLRWICRSFRSTRSCARALRCRSMSSSRGTGGWSSALPPRRVGIRRRHDPGRAGRRGCREDPRRPIGTVADLREASRYADGRYDILTVGTRRFRLEAVTIADEGYLLGSVRLLDEPVGDPVRARELAVRAGGLFIRYLELLRPGENEPADASGIDLRVEMVRRRRRGAGRPGRRSGCRWRVRSPPRTGPPPRGGTTSARQIGRRTPDHAG